MSRCRQKAFWDVALAMSPLEQRIIDMHELPLPAHVSAAVGFAYPVFKISQNRGLYIIVLGMTL